MDRITAAQAAEKLGVTKVRVIQLIVAGRLPAEKLGSQYVIRPADLERVKDRPPGRPPKAGAKPRAKARRK